MANAVFEYLKSKFKRKDTITKVNELVKGYKEEFYSPLVTYEWIDNVKKRQKGLEPESAMDLINRKED